MCSHCVSLYLSSLSDVSMILCSLMLLLLFYWSSSWNFKTIPIYGYCYKKLNVKQINWRIMVAVSKYITSARVYNDAIGVCFDITIFLWRHYFRLTLVFGERMKKLSFVFTFTVWNIHFIPLPVIQYSSYIRTLVSCSQAGRVIEGTDTDR